MDIDTNENTQTLADKTATNEQRTEEWYRKRYDLLTASDCASALEANPFQSKVQLYNKKTREFALSDYTKNPIDAIEHGIKYEPIALKIYQRFENVKVNSVGLYTHSKHKWLGASPDGITETGKLVEIKCVYRRYLYDKPPLYYWIQTQIQMEVTDIDECDLFQCKFIEYPSKATYKEDTKTSLKGKFTYQDKRHYWKLEQYKCTTIKRDRKWFKRSLPLMKLFWNSVLTARTKPLKPLKTSKRKRDVPPERLRIRALSMDNSYTDWNSWVSGSNTRNYAMREPLLDFLNLYGKSHGIKTDDEIDLSLDSGKFLKEQGTKFENAVCSNIIHRIGADNVVKIGSYEEANSTHKFDITVQAMNEGVPLILQGVLHDTDTKTYGVVDMICRSDYLSTIFEHAPIEYKTSYKSAKKLKTSTKYPAKKNSSHSHSHSHSHSSPCYHYTIIDIKYTTLRLFKHSDTLCNDPQMLANKMKICVYNQILSKIQGYESNCAYILGKRVIDDKQKINNPFYMAGIVDFAERDSHILEDTEKAIKWYRDVKTNGSKWKLYPPSRPELYPNMSNAFDYPWHTAKKELAHRTKDITVLWYCGPKQRELAHKHNVYSWDDPKCTAELVGFKNARGKQLQKILDVNQSNSSIIPKKNGLPEEALEVLKPFNRHDKSRQSLTFYVDFETVSDCEQDFNIIKNYKPDKYSDDKLNDLLKPKFSNLVYLIGFVYEEPNKNRLRKKTYMIKDLTAESEAEILKEFVSDMNKIKLKYGWKQNEFPQLYHWGHAEITTMIKAIERTPEINKLIGKYSWFNLCDYVKSVPITVKGVFSFGLKDVVKGMYSAGMIPTKWEDDTIDGKAAMFAVINANKRCKEKNITLCEDEEMIQITQYNEIDCKVMFEIVEFLRVQYIPKYQSKYFEKIKFSPI